MSGIIKGIGKLIDRFPFAPFLVLAFSTIITHFQRFGMYFWHDDYTTLYRFQDNVGIKYPYQETVLIKPLVNIFGLNYIPFVAINLILTILVAHLVYRLAVKLFKNKTIALISSLIFTNGYVGQEESLQLITLGLNTVAAMGFLVGALISFFNFHERKRKVYLALTFIFFFLAIELSTFRYGTALLIFLILDWMLFFKSKSKKILGVISRNLGFIFTFSLVYIFHITRIVLKYPITYEKEATLFRLQNLDASIFQHIGNAVGIFWNTLYPKIYQTGPYSPLFVLAFFAFLLILVRMLRKKSPLLPFLLVSIVWIFIAAKFTIDRSIVSGGILIAFLTSLLIARVPSSSFNALFSLLLFCILLTFLYTNKMYYVYDTVQRYLFSASFAPVFLTSFFITNELVKPKNKKQKRLAWIFFLLPTIALIIFPYWAGFKEATNFRINRSEVAIKFYSDLKKNIPEITDKKVIYMEGSTKELGIAVFDAVRTGGLPSEASLAVQYKTKIENITLAKNPEEVLKILKENPKLSTDNIYYFIYSDNGLEDHSESFRSLIRKAHSFQPITLPLSQKIPSQLPLKVRVVLSATGDVQFEWDYNTFGRLSMEKHTIIKTPGDQRYREYEFTIPASSLYLESLGAKPVLKTDTVYISRVEIKSIN